MQRKLPQTIFQTIFGISPQIRILEVFLRTRTIDITMKEIKEKSGVSNDAAYEIVRKMIHDGYVERTRMIGRLVFYRLTYLSELLYLIKFYNELDEVKNEKMQG